MDGGDEAEGWPPVAKVNWQFNKFAKFPRAELRRPAAPPERRKLRSGKYVQTCIYMRGPRRRTDLTTFYEADVARSICLESVFSRASPREYLLIERLFISTFSV